MVAWGSSYVEDDEPDPPLWPPLLALAAWLAIPVCVYLWVTGGVEMTWSKTPPTKSGWYWVSQDEDQFPAFFNWAMKTWWHGDDEEWEPLDGAMFGPAIPSPEQCAEIAKGGGA